MTVEFMTTLTLDNIKLSLAIVKEEEFNINIVDDEGVREIIQDTIHSSMIPREEPQEIIKRLMKG
jgi:hypothetical protein